MTKYARFDHTKPEPQPVTGWYDTEMHNYPNLPAAADLLALTDAQWAARLPNPSGWLHKGGGLIPPGTVVKPPVEPAKVTTPATPTKAA